MANAVNFVKSLRVMDSTPEGIAMAGYLAGAIDEHNEPNSAIDEPAFPCPSSLHGHPFNGLSKKEWFAANAPTEIPAWFGPIIGETIGIHFGSQAVFLKWRQWYGEQMAELFNK